jgi:hypothetical protein
LDAVERQLRDHAATASGPRAGFYRRLLGPETYWPATSSIRLQTVEEKDEPTECMRVSVRVADTHGFEVVNGYVVAREHGPLWHCWNRDPATGMIVDAAEARRTATGYLGRVLTDSELDLLRRSSELPTAAELLGAAGSRLAGFGRVLGGLLD